MKNMHLVGARRPGMGNKDSVNVRQWLTTGQCRTVLWSALHHNECARHPSSVSSSNTQILRDRTQLVKTALCVPLDYIPVGKRRSSFFGFFKKRWPLSPRSIQDVNRKEADYPNYEKCLLHRITRTTRLDSTSIH